MKRLVSGEILFTPFAFSNLCTLVAASAQQPSFAVATIRPSSASVQFEHDGKTETTPGTIRMQDVSVQTCIKWAYGVQGQPDLWPILDAVR